MSVGAGTLCSSRVIDLRAVRSCDAIVGAVAVGMGGVVPVEVTPPDDEFSIGLEL